MITGFRVLEFFIKSYLFWFVSSLRLKAESVVLSMKRFLVLNFSQLGTPLQPGEVGARGVSAPRAATREARGERGSASMTTGWLPPPPSFVADARRTTSLAQTVPLNMSCATRVSAQVAQVRSNLFQRIFCLPQSIRLGVFPSISQSVSLGKAVIVPWNTKEEFNNKR